MKKGLFYYKWLFLFVGTTLSMNFIQADDVVEGLDLHADKATSNLNTAESKLSGNIILRHRGFQITGDLAEVRNKISTDDQTYIIAGSPVVFTQSLNASTMRAQANWLNYDPIAEKVHFKKNVAISSTFKNGKFIISASDILLQLNQRQPSKLEAIGDPLIFSNQLSMRSIQIEASRISWDSETDIATLYFAKVIDNQVVFSADEIIYNFKTGELSAIGEGDSRPNYRFDPNK